jgi:hypothetical protein
MRSRLNVIIGGDIFITFMSYNIIRSWILFLNGGCSWPFILQELYLRPISCGERSILEKYFLDAIMSSQKKRITRFPYNPRTAFETTYFLRSNVCQTPSSVNNLASHFPSKALFLNSRSWTPSPPWSLGRQMTLHFINQYFFFYYLLVKRILIENNLIYVRLL